MAQVSGAWGGPLLTLLHLTHHWWTYSTYCLSSRFTWVGLQPQSTMAPRFQGHILGLFPCSHCSCSSRLKAEQGRWDGVHNTVLSSPTFFLHWPLSTFLVWLPGPKITAFDGAYFLWTPPPPPTHNSCIGQHICLGTSVVILTPDYILSPL